MEQSQLEFSESQLQNNTETDMGVTLCRKNKTIIFFYRYNVSMALVLHISKYCSTSSLMCHRKYNIDSSAVLKSVRAWWLSLELKSTIRSID